ncbi:hypothetical protein NESM_000424000 [Novymonas esmeraldas]|uniref:Uncharacterized protein n=1 Tax=Novymonas esmeraldas TaxID=1808958 RepID=A0AAW0ELF5_9TRYP
MDAVQRLIAGVGQADLEGGQQCSPTAAAVLKSGLGETSASAAPPPPPPPPPRRTKMVFVYSDEDEDEDGRTATVAQNGVAEVSCDGDVIDASADVLAELRAEAAEAPSASPDPDEFASPLGALGDSIFHEDVVGGGLDVITAAAAVPTIGGMRVREVTAPRLWDGAIAPPDWSESAATIDEVPQLLRRGLPAATFVLESRRKRFREAPQLPQDELAASPATVHTSAATAATSSSAASVEAPASSDPAAAAAAAAPSARSLPSATQGSDSDGDDDAVEVVEETLDVHPVYDEDGIMVRALRTRGGYELTLDERDLLEDPAEACGEGELDGAHATPCDAAHAAGEDDAADGERMAVAGDAPDSNGGAGGEDWGDDDDLDDEEDEEEAELDEAIIVAVVEQLVSCCEADDLDQQMQVEATRFTATAKPLLEELTTEAITPGEFVQRIDRDLRRFQRIYKSVYRPRDAPIVVDGVVTDL